MGLRALRCVCAGALVYGKDSKMDDKTKIDIAENADDNANEVEASADLSGSEDTGAAYEDIISAKDEIIGAYQKQVSSLKAQIAQLVRDGAAINDGSKLPESPKTMQQANLGGFGKGADAYGGSLGLADLGREIGKRD